MAEPETITAWIGEALSLPPERITLSRGAQRAARGLPDAALGALTQEERRLVLTALSRRLAQSRMARNPKTGEAYGVPAIAPVSGRHARQAMLTAGQALARIPKDQRSEAADHLLAICDCLNPVPRP